MIGVDTNVLVRYFAKDDAAQGAAARSFFERQARIGEKVRIGVVVLAELAWVLQSRFGATRDELGQVVDELLADRRLDVQDEEAVAVVVNDFLSSSAGFVELLIAAVNTLHGCEHTMTFDRKAAKLDGMALLS